MSKPLAKQRVSFNGATGWLVSATLLVDCAQRGVGGDTQWSEFGRPLSQYRTTLTLIRVAMRLTPFTGEGTMADKARLASATGEN